MEKDKLIRTSLEGMWGEGVWEGSIAVMISLRSVKLMCRGMLRLLWS
jgi:hypothetical protein